MNRFKEYPLINAPTLSMLKKNTADNPEFLLELFQSFIDDSQELIDELEQTAQANNIDEYYIAVHTLKGLSGTIGCSRMFELLKLMDTLNKEKNFNDSMAYLEMLTIVFRETSDEIKEQILN
jgi:HPt (histidine-containing phosphotransfer) domain-containing protein